MKTESINQNKTLVTVLHLSVFTKYFIPLGNFIFPMLLWLSRKQDAFVDHHGRNALNFQISMFLYTVFLVAVGAAAMVYFGIKLSLGQAFFMEHGPEFPGNFSDALPFIITAGILGILLLGLFILELFAVISASLKASEGKLYNYPLSIRFIGSGDSEESNHQNHQSKNEQFNSTEKQRL
ncbi:DUF4870 domain-containing protein [Christiangramia salexigens]|uniref:DUF4870 domain-containing protein n=1 Tax=Christiangramia salexigens TaxID=1913577 RepID=A0A1L3J3W5_9FLAO|nr:DUF4870 domain-containing protein [Christiangramia salexigens]APG59792.1 hypothetical protein LPB144_04890 [Christiangramia salexigens]